jgi:predicted 3'-5' exonuclease similar to PolB exonuclease domain
VPRDGFTGEGWNGGDEVEKYYRDGHIREIAEYCESDVLNTYRVWLRYELSSKEERKGPSVFADGAGDAADRYASLPLELRLAALCLPIPENLARAA